MSTILCGRFLPLSLAVGLLPAGVFAQAASTDSEKLTAAETIQVTTTRIPEDVETVPVSITVISGDELRQRGATDLASALAWTAGVAVAPGGDGGPAGSVPEIWGLREFDAFLLVVDGVPAGGAFNPTLTTLDFENLDRIEVLRGSAPVMYGATSFSGVIHVIHRAAGAEGRSARVFGGSYGSGGGAVSTPLPSLGSYRQSISADYKKQGFKDDRTEFDRGHVLYRGAAETAAGRFRLDFDGTVLGQDPASPHPRQGRVLSPAVPLDANHNPRGAKIDDDRFQLAGGYDRTLGNGLWSTTLSLTHTKRDTVRGFLLNLSNTSPNSRGYRQELELDDLYFDTHLETRLSPTLQLVAGVDHLYGRAEAEAQDFDYFASLDGRTVPSAAGLPGRMAFEVEDERHFSGVYGQLEWAPAPRWKIHLGARFNRAVEDREAGEEELQGGEEPGEEEEEGRDSRTTSRGSGILGVNFLAWQGEDAAVWLFGNYRDTFKPAAIDFGPEAEPEILKPETATSYEIGAKGRHGERFEWEVSGFQMDFTNLVVAQIVNGLPALINAGEERFKGFEVELRGRLARDLTAQATYAHHDAKFTDFVQEFDGVPTRLDGNRLELSPRQLASAGLIWAPATGFHGTATYSRVGDRFLNKRNTALSPAYDTWSAGIGYRFAAWDLRVDGENLNDARPPVSESELGDAQYYRLPARFIRVSAGWRF